MARRESDALIWESSCELIKLAIDYASELQPLPAPPLLFEDMPISVPNSEKIRQRAIGLHAADRAGFTRLLAEAVENQIPDFVSRSIDVERAEEKWMANNVAQITQKVVLGRLNEWLSTALDPVVPDGERWYLAAALLTGLAHTSPDTIVADTSHLFESIAIASPPGRWSTRSAPGPHNLDWRQSDTRGPISPDSNVDGVIAVNWLIDALAKDVEANQTILAEWILGFSVRLHLHGPLRYDEWLLTLAPLSESTGIAAAAALPHLLESSPEASQILTKSLLNHPNVSVRRRLLEVTPSIFPLDLQLGLNLIDNGLIDLDSDVRVLATSALNSLDRWDELAFIERCVTIVDHSDPRVRRRFGQTGLRSCLAIDPSDERQILSRMWVDDDETLRARLEIFMIEMAENDPNSFKQQLARIIQEKPNAADRLLAALKARNIALD